MFLALLMPNDDTSRLRIVVNRLTLQVCDHGLMFVLEFLEALGFLLLLCQVGGELRDPLFKHFLLL